MNPVLKSTLPPIETNLEQVGDAEELYGIDKKFGLLSIEDPSQAAIKRCAEKTVSQLEGLQWNATPSLDLYLYSLNQQTLLNKNVEQLHLSGLANHQFAEKLKAASINSSPLDTFSVYQLPLPNKGSYDPLHSLAQYSILETMAGMHAIGTVFELTGEVIAQGAKAVCGLTETTEKACQVTADFAKKIIETVAAKLPNCDGSTLAKVLEKEYGFPKPQAEQMAQQFVADTKTIATGAAIGGAGALALKGAKTLLGKVKVTPCVVSEGSDPFATIFSGHVARAPYLGPTAGFEAYTQAESAIVQKLLQPYRHLKSDGDLHPRVTYADIPKHSDVYFHATSLERALGVLQSSSIKRFDMTYYLGAFVSSKPESLMGAVVFAFNRSIEKTSKVLNASFEGGRHWAGFSEAIPVTSESLEYIAVHAELLAQGPIETLAKQLSVAAGREIPVVPLEPIVQKITQRALQEGFFVPEGWPTNMSITHR